jgi:DNA-binding CsgD family transcriptional regulator
MAPNAVRDTLRIWGCHHDARVGSTSEVDNDRGLLAVHDDEVLAERAAARADRNHPGNTCARGADSSKFRPRIIDGTSVADGAQGNTNIWMHRLEFLELGHRDHEVRSIHRQGRHSSILRRIALRLARDAGGGTLARGIGICGRTGCGPADRAAQERTITGLVCQGMSTIELAAATGISTSTVQDYLKSVFDKVGVRSRRELVVQVLRDQYVPHAQAGWSVGASGYFA